MAVSSHYPQARCRVTGGEVSELKTNKKPLSTFKAHNFTDRLDLLLPSSLYKSLKFEFKAFQGYEFKCHVKEVLHEAVLNLMRVDGFVVKLTSAPHMTDDPIAISIINNTFHLRLSDSYSTKTGITMKKSQFKGENSVHLSLDLTKPDLVHDTIFLKLLHFLQSLNDDEATRTFTLQVSDKSFVPQALDQHQMSLLMARSKSFDPIEITDRVTELPQVSVIDLTIKRDDPDWALETMDFLAYLSIGGQQLTNEIDPYLSQYPQSLSSTTKQDVVKVSFQSSLIPSAYISATIIEQLKDANEWFSILVHGCEYTNYSFGSSEHVFHESGENNISYLQSNGQFVLWEVTGGRDNY